MAAPYWALQICPKYFDEYLRFGFLTLPTEWFLNIFFVLHQDCMTVQANNCFSGVNIHKLLSA